MHCQLNSTESCAWQTLKRPEYEYPQDVQKDKGKTYFLFQTKQHREQNNSEVTNNAIPRLFKTEKTSGLICTVICYAKENKEPTLVEPKKCDESSKTQINEKDDVSAFSAYPYTAN